MKIARTILTYSGLYVDPLDLRPHDVCIEDIAHALSNQCRFTGHTRVFYSVAEHCCRVTAELIRDGYSIEAALWGLLHDAPEAYLVDLPRPLKHDDEIGAAFRRYEQPRHGRNRGGEPEAVKHYDLALLATERRDLMPLNGEWSLLADVAPLPDPIVPLPPEQARHEFHSLFELLATPIDAAVA